MIQSLLDNALRLAEGKRITDVHIVVGELSTLIIDESIQSDWDRIARNSAAEGARLHFRRVPAELQCMVCFEKYRPTGREVFCPYCGSVGAKILAGEELYIAAVDVEEQMDALQ